MLPPRQSIADWPMLVDGTFNPDGQMLVTSLRSRFILRQGDQYQVGSRVSVADATSLEQTRLIIPSGFRIVTCNFPIRSLRER